MIIIEYGTPRSKLACACPLLLFATCYSSLTNKCCVYTLLWMNDQSAYQCIWCAVGAQARAAPCVSPILWCPVRCRSYPSTGFSRVGLCGA